MCVTIVVALVATNIPLLFHCSVLLLLVVFSVVVILVNTVYCCRVYCHCCFWYHGVPTILDYTQT